MIKCPFCYCAAHTRSSFQVTSKTKERYNQCTNINCAHTFVSHETYVRSIVKPGAIDKVNPHPENHGQAGLAV